MGVEGVYGAACQGLGAVAVSGQKPFSAGPRPAPPVRRCAWSPVEVSRSRWRRTKREIQFESDRPSRAASFFQRNLSSRSTNKLTIRSLLVGGVRFFMHST